MLRCDRARARQYRDESGREFFSVSQIRRVMHDGMAGVPTSALEPARQRGQVLHQYLWQLLASRAGLCEVPALIDAYHAQCQSLIWWAEIHTVTPIKLEEASCNATLGFAGTPDALVTYGRTKTVTLLDLKTGAKQPTDPAQLLAYATMEGYQCKKMLDLYVNGKGEVEETFVTATHKITQWPWFMGALNVLTSRANHGLQ